MVPELEATVADYDLHFKTLGPKLFMKMFFSEGKQNSWSDVKVTLKQD